MSKSIERIEKFLNPGTMDRVYEVMNIFGLKFPKDFDIYVRYYVVEGFSKKYDYDELDENLYQNYAASFKEGAKNLDDLEQEDLDKIGYFEFSKFAQSIEFIKDGYFFSWTKSGNNHESICVSKDKRYNLKNRLSVSFNVSGDGLESSTLVIHGLYEYPVIRSYVNNVKAEDNIRDFNEQVPIDEYYEFFRRMLSNKNLEYIMPESLRSEELMDLIAKIMSGPINDFVADLKSNDQTYRYEREAERIAYICDQEKRSAKIEYDNVVNDAKRRYQSALQKADTKKNVSLKELFKDKEEYKVPGDKPRVLKQEEGSE